MKNFQLAAIYVGKHCDIHSSVRRLDEKRRREGRFLSAARGLFLSGVEVEVGFVEIAFALPVADYVFDAVLFMGGSHKEVALMVQ